MNVFPIANPRPLFRMVQNAARLRHACAGALLLIALLSTAMPAFTANETSTPATRAEVSGKKTDLKELRGQIETLRKQMNAAEGQRADAADQVKDVERNISTTQRELYKLSGEQARLQATLRDLDKQEQMLADNLGALHAQLADLVTRRYLQGHPDALQLLLNGESPSQTARDLYYLSIIGLARKQLLAETTVLLQRKRTLAENVRERSEELSTVEARQKEQRTRLLTQREQRKDPLPDRLQDQHVPSGKVPFRPSAGKDSFWEPEQSKTVFIGQSAKVRRVQKPLPVCREVLSQRAWRSEPLLPFRRPLPFCVGQQHEERHPLDRSGR